MNAGMLAIGKTKPLSMKKGRMKKKLVIMACCWVRETVEISSPIPSVLSRKTELAASRTRAKGRGARALVAALRLSRRLVGFAMALFLAGSVLSGLATCMTQLIAARALRH